MRIALTHPAYGSERGGETARIMQNLAVALVERGHEITVLTSRADGPTSTTEAGVRVVRARRLPQIGPLRSHEHYVTNAPSVISGVAHGRFDVVHAFFHVDACAAQIARDHLGGPPVVFTLPAIPTRPYLVERRYRLELWDRAVNRSDAATAAGTEAAEAAERYFGGGVEVVGDEADRYEAIYARAIN